MYLNTLYKKIAEWEIDFLKNLRHDKEAEDKHIIIGVNENYQAGWHSNLPFKATFNPDIKYATSINYTRNTSPNYIPKEQNSMFFRSNYGVFAGFVTFFKGRSVDYWTNIENYLTSRYSIIMQNNEQLISNKLVPSIENSNLSYYDTKVGLKIHSYEIGKDERAIIFGIIPYYLNDCYFYFIEYNAKIGNYYVPDTNTFHSQHVYEKVKNIQGFTHKKNLYQKIDLINARVENVLSYATKNTHESFNTYMHRQFADFSNKYKAWLAKFPSKLNKYKKNMAKKMTYKSTAKNIPKRGLTLFGKTFGSNKKSVASQNLFVKLTGGKKSRKTKKKMARKTRKIKH
jgi:hypothetical protein